MNKKMAIITTITLQVALKIGAAEIFNQIEKFSKEANDNEYIEFTHYNFFYSYPGWNNKWLNGKDCEFHRVYTKCHLCSYMPERNYAGVGSIYLLNNGICNGKVLVCNNKKMEYVTNTPQLTRMILLCPNHVSSHFMYCKNKEGKKAKPLQLSLF